jgi:hypothetical protein
MGNDLDNAAGSPLPRRVIRQLGHFPVPKNIKDTDRQVKEYDSLCGPVTTGRVYETEYGWVAADEAGWTDEVYETEAEARAAVTMEKLASPED